MNKLSTRDWPCEQTVNTGLALGTNCQHWTGPVNKLSTRDWPCEQACTVSASSVITLDAVHCLLRKRPTKSSVLYPLSTSLIKANTDLLASPLAMTINKSLESGIPSIGRGHTVVC